MDINQMRTFCVVAEELSFTRAATRLHISQPPLSRKIKALETSLGTKLFNRCPQGLTLTRTGELLYDESKKIIRKIDSTKKTIESIEKGRREIFRIGFVPSVFYGFLPRTVKDLRDANDMEIILKELTTAQQLSALKAGDINIGFGRLKIEDPEIKQETLFEEPLVAALPSEHPMAGRPISLEDLSNIPLILYPTYPSPNLSEILLGYFHSHYITPKVVQDTNELQTALGLVSSGLGATFAPMNLMDTQRSGITYSTITDPIPTTPVIMSHLHTDTKKPGIISIKKNINHFLFDHKNKITK